MNKTSAQKRSAASWLAELAKKMTTFIRASRTTVMMSLIFSLLAVAVLMIKTPF